ncbi:MAG: ion transporter [Gemmatimonadota bacterium]|nr:ion transporter [Gemmatimonadota bacterium]
MSQTQSRMLNTIHRLVPFVLGVNMILYIVELQFTQTQSSLDEGAWPGFIWIERVIACIFTVEYLLRIVFAENRVGYLTRPLGLIDLLSILPFWLGFYPGLSQEMLGLIRGTRTFRLLKIFRYSSKMQSFVGELYYGRTRFTPILLIIFIYLMIGSTVIYEVERRAQSEVFQEYADGIWWAVVTSTTVGYGDKFPISRTGQGVGIILMIIGIGIVGMVFGLFAEAYQGNREALDEKLMDAYCKAIHEEGVHGKTPQILRDVHGDNAQFILFSDTVGRYIGKNT